MREWVKKLLTWRRLSKTEGDGNIVREILASDRTFLQYDIVVRTGSVKGGGTDANVHIQLFGDKVNFLLLGEDVLLICGKGRQRSQKIE